MASLISFLFLILLPLLTVSQSLDLDQIPVASVRARGPCCAECPGALRNCVELFLQGNKTEPCTMTVCEFDAPKVADGDIQTALELDVSSSSDKGLSFTLELGSLYEVQEVRILRSPNTPSSSLYLSTDGLVFKLVANNSVTTGSGEVFNLTSLEGDVSNMATHIRISLSQSASPLFVVMEILVFGEEVGCGVCVDQLLDSLRNLTELINIGLAGLPNAIPVEVLRAEIEDLQASVAHLEGTLLVLDVVLGRREQLEDDIELPSTVVRYDLLLTPPIPDKLNELRTLLASFNASSLDTRDLAQQLDRLEQNVGEVLNRTRSFDEEVKAFETSINETTNRLSDELSSILNAISQVNITHATITNRNHTPLIPLLEIYQSQVNSILSEVQFFLADVENTSQSVVVITETLVDLEALLEGARNRAVSTNWRALEAFNNTERAEGLVTEIRALLLEAESINVTIDVSLSTIENILVRGEMLFEEATTFTHSSLTLLPTLTTLLSNLRQVLDDYSLSLAIYRPPESCDPSSTPCTSGQIHADSLSQNASFIINSTDSMYTLIYARDFLESIRDNGQLFDYSELNATALRAQNISQNAISQLSTTNISSLLSRSSVTLSAAEFLSSQSSSLLQRAEDVNSTVVRNQGRVETIQARLDDLRPLLPPIVNRTSQLLSQTGLREEALQTLTLAQIARNKTIDTNERVTFLETELVGVASNVRGAAENVRDGEEALDDAESKFYSISTFLNATRVAAEAFTVNVTQFIAENDRIIAEIDSLVAGLADIHSRINRINSPIQLENNEEERSYISLQSPPGRSINDTIQFETLDLYIRTGPDFRSPSLLFYAGPTYFEGIDEISNGENGTEDYFLLTAEDDDIQLRWQMGGTEGVASLPAFRQGLSQIFISRVGSQFQLRIGVSVDELDNIVAMGAVANDSLLFRTSNRTSFFLGGWPEGAQLGVPTSIVPVSSLNPFQGQVQLLLFNGEQWGLWNVRGSSDTMFIGSFFRNELASQNTWNGPRDTLSSSAAISFNGRGFLWVGQLGNVVNFDVQRRTMTIIARPNDETDGLVLYAYDPELRLSMEVAFQRGSLRMIFRDHDRTDPLVEYEQLSSPSIVATSGRDGRQLEILYFNTVGYRVNDQQFLTRSASRFFTDLTRVKAWYGGVRQDMLESPFVPEITNSSYYGCIDLFVEGQFVRNILRGSDYTDFYLNSPVQQGFSGTCLQSIYTRDIGLLGEQGAYLSYPYLELVGVTNSPAPVSEGVSPDVTSLSVSFFPQRDDGVILAAISGDHSVYAVMRDGVVVVGVTGGAGGHVTQVGDGPISLEVWHYLLIELVPNQYMSYVDGISQGSPVSSPGLNFQLSTNPVNSGPGVLFVGGIDEGVVMEIDDLPPFTGCMSDFAYNFGAMSFLNPSMTTSQARYPSGVVYNTCPFVNVSLDPLLAVRPDPTEPTFCLATHPVDLVNTHGGFHTQTRLTTSNVIGLFESSWEMSILLKQTRDGHVITIATTQGHQISLVIRGSMPILSLSNSSSQGEPKETSGSVALESNVFTPIFILCSTMADLLTCSLMVDNVTAGEPLQTFYNGSIFFPELPLILGQKEDSQGNTVNSFVGCISSLATNGDTAGFVTVDTDVPCYNNTESGLGFTGISQLGTDLPTLSENKTTVEVTLTFRPIQQNGLLLLVTTNNQSEALITVGMFNGQLRVSNFNLSSSDNFLSFSSPSTVCNSSLPVYYTLSLVYNETTFTVAVGEEGTEGAAKLVLDTPLSLPSLNSVKMSLTVGDTPAGYSVPDGSGQFLFLLSEDVSADSLPPGLVGCVRRVEVDGGEVGVENADIAKQILVGLCPAEG